MRLIRFGLVVCAALLLAAPRCVWGADSATTQPSEPTNGLSKGAACELVQKQDDGDLEKLAAATAELGALYDGIKAQAAAPPNVPPVVDAPVVAAPANSPSSVDVAQLKMIVAGTESQLKQAQWFNQDAAAEMKAAREAPSPAQAEQHYELALKRQEAAKGIIAGLTQQLKSGSHISAAAPVKPVPLPPPTAPLHFESKTYRLLEKMVPVGGSAALVSAARAFDGATAAALVQVDHGSGTHFFSLPSASGPQKQPGGIKFSGARAEQLASALDVTSIEFDPVHGRIVLAGQRLKSEQAFDLDVFADVLRLAAEEYEPFFSLDPAEPADWDSWLTRISKALARKYSDQDLARRVRSLSPVGIPLGDRTYYYTTVEVLDPELAAEANRGRDLSVKVIYSPAWLRYSKVGAILFDADLAIKAVASGFLERDGAIEPAFVWQLPDFHPVWLQRGEGSAGRANFELAHALVRQSGLRLDLAEIHPGLYVTERRSGTDQDLAPSDHDRQISRLFDQHWQDFVEHVPEIARLEMVFRAYVAARFLIDHHPGLAARIAGMPREDPPEQPPLRIVNPSVIRVAFNGDTPVPISGDSEAMYDLSGGYGGGIDLRVEEVNGKKSAVQVQDVPVDPNDWVHGLLAATYGDQGYSELPGRGAAALLEFDSPGLPLHWHVRMIGAIAALLVLTAGASLVLRQFDWQQLALRSTCRHCVRVHRWIGRLALALSAITAAGMLYLGLLPLAAAADVPWSGPQVGAAVAVLAAVVSSLILLGLLARAIATARSGVPRNRGPGTALFTGAHVACIAFAIFLFHGGFSASAIGGNLARLLGPTVAECIFARLGGIGPPAIAALVAAGASTLVILFRWAGPYVFDSRPLPLLRFSAHSHSTAHS